MNKKHKVHWNFDIRINKYFWGVVLLCVAAAILIDALGIAPEFLQGLGVWKILLIIVMAGWIVNSLLRLEFGSIVIPLAFIFMATKQIIANAVGIQSIGEISNGTVILFACVFIFGSICIEGIAGKLVMVLAFAVALLKSWLAQVISLPQLSELSNWMIFCCGILFAVGINFIIPIKRKSHHIKFSGNNKNGDTSSMGSKVRYIDCNDLTEAYAKNSFGEYEIFFQNIDNYPGNAVLNVENHFGEIRINVPDTWCLEDNISNSFGECTVPKGNPNGKILRIEGVNKFGSIVARQYHYTGDEYNTITDESINMNGNKSAIISKYINCENFTNETIHNNAGVYEVFFSNIDKFQADYAELRIENKAGSVTVNVPTCWGAINCIVNNAGTCNCECKICDSKPLLKIYGENKAGNINIVYYDYN